MNYYGNDTENYVLAKCFGSNELMHWKYIKRVKKNGKWRYYYDSSANKLTNLQKQRQKLESEHNTKFEKYYANRWTEDLASTPKSDTVGRENVNRWYGSDKIKEFFRDGYSTEMYSPGTYDQYKIDSIRYYEDKRAKSIGGAVDKFMAKNGRKIAKNLNSISDSVSSTTKKGKDWIDSKISNYKKKKIKVKYEEAVLE